MLLVPALQMHAGRIGSMSCEDSQMEGMRFCNAKQQVCAAVGTAGDTLHI